MACPESQQTELDILKNFNRLESVKQLFWFELNYDRVDQFLSRRGWTDVSSKALADEPALYATGGQDEGFHVIYAPLTSDSLCLGNERPVVARLIEKEIYKLAGLTNQEIGLIEGMDKGSARSSD